MLVWGNLGEDDERVPVSEYSFFHGFDPPDTYGVWLP